jgi:hypothetical protein
MIVHNKPTFNVKKALIIAGVVVVVLASVGVGGWSILAAGAETSFNNSLGDVKLALSTRLQTGQTELKTLVAAADDVKTAEYLKTLATDVDAQLEDLPTAQNVLGISLVNASRQEDRQALAQKIANLTVALRATSDLLTYERTVVEPLVSIQQLAGKDAAEQTKLAAGWADLVKQLQAMTPPEVAAQAHKALSEQVASTQVILAALPALYTKKDEAGFAAKSKELTAAIQNLQAMQSVFHDIEVASDKTLGETYQALQQHVAE